MRARILVMLFCTLILIFCLLLTDGCGIPETYVPPNPPSTPINPPPTIQEKLDAANSLDDFEVLLHEAKLFKIGTPSLVVSRRRQWYVNNHPNLTPQIRNSILNGNICLQMASEQVRASLGLPRDINRTVSTFGVHEQWVYGEYGSLLLYFEDDILTAWQD